MKTFEARTDGRFHDRQETRQANRLKALVRSNYARFKNGTILTVVSAVIVLSFGGWVGLNYQIASLSAFGVSVLLVFMK